MYSEFEVFVRDVFNKKAGSISLHEPFFTGLEKEYVNEAIDSTFVSSVGKFVDEFERKLAEYVGCKYAIATVNGTSALHIALLLSEVEKDNEVLCQSLTFIATTNAILYTGAAPVFIDVELETLGMSPDKLESYLRENTFIDKEGSCINKRTKKRIKACVVMHTFGFPSKIIEIRKICNAYNIDLIEDAAESLGSKLDNKFTGTFGKTGVFSFNGNKIITAGGGGAIVTNDKKIAETAKHITTTAKVKHEWEFIHNQIGYNYRMPNLNAAFVCAQMDFLERFIENKKELHNLYSMFFDSREEKFILPPDNSRPNYWLNCILLKDKKARDGFLKNMNSRNIQCRPVWNLIHELPFYNHYQRDDLIQSKSISDRLVNIPSSVRSI